MALDKGKTYTAQCNGVQLTAEISPCSWMYPGHGFQLNVALANGTWGLVRRNDLAFADATEQDVQSMLAGVKVIPCKTCGDHALDPETVSNNRDSECNSCFTKPILAGIAQDQAKAKAEFEMLDAQYKQQGCTHRVDAWIHTVDDGDRPIPFSAGHPHRRRCGVNAGQGFTPAGFECRT